MDDLFEGNSWASLLAQNDPQSMQLIADLGKKALASGEINPKEAAKNAKLLGFKNPGKRGRGPASVPGEVPSVSMAEAPTPDNAVSMTQGQGAPSGPVSDAYKASGMGSLVGIKGAGAKLENDDSQRYTRSENRIQTKTGDQALSDLLIASGDYPTITGYEPTLGADGHPLTFKGEPVLDYDRPIYDNEHTNPDPRHPIQKQEADLNGLQQLLAAQGRANLGRSNLDLSPLLALADARNAEMGNKTDLAGGYKKPEDQTGKFTEFAAELQKRRGDLGKAILENVKSAKAGSSAEQYLQAIAAKNALTQGDGSSGRLGLEDRLKLQERRQAVTSLENVKRRLSSDPISKQQLQPFFTLGNALSQLQNVNQLSPNILHEVQQKIRNAIQQGGGGTSGVDERAATYIKSLGWNWETWKQFLTSKPADIAKDDDLVAHLREQAVIEQSNIKSQISSRISALSSGNEWWVERPEFDDLARSLYGAVGAYNSQSSGIGATPMAGGRKAIKRGTTLPKAPGLAPGGKLMGIDEFFGKGG